MLYLQPLFAQGRLHRLILRAVEGDPTAIAIIALVVVVFFGIIVVKTRRTW